MTSSNDVEPASREDENASTAPGCTTIDQSSAFDAPLGLATLPLELLFKVVTKLEWIDILRVRQVSRSFFSFFLHPNFTLPR
jgi:hypothetical protein